MPKISILHISDLHKIPQTNYESLVQSLLDDRNAYMAQGVMSPNYIVVSGDLIQGGDIIDEIRNQYSEVKDFLSRLCHEFLGDDKSRVIIVPGNHDVSYPDSRLSMASEARENQSNNLASFKTHSPEIRWKWEEFAFYKISDKLRYSERFHLFIEFYNDFYEGLRQYPDHPTKEADCIPFQKDQVAFVLFNSCDGLDHLNNTANIDEDALSSVMQNLRENFNMGLLNIGVWHHHYYGGPYETNYLHRERIAAMSHRFIRIGMFGHQHMSQVAEFFSGDLAFSEGQDNDKVLLISSGTLFGGSRELPYGCKRQYNIVEIDIENGKADVLIHVREDHNVNVQSKIPYWGRKDFNATGTISATVSLKELTEDEQLARFVRYVKAKGEYKYGIKYLEDRKLEGGIYDKLRSDFVRNIHDDEYILHRFKPSSKEEYLLKMSVALKVSDSEVKKELLSDERLQTYMDDPVVEEMYIQLSD